MSSEAAFLNCQVVCEWNGDGETADQTVASFTNMD